MSVKAKLLWRCRRGVKELDVVLLRYLESCYDDSAAADKQAFEQLLAYQDPDILCLLLQQKTADDENIARIIETMRHLSA